MESLIDPNRENRVHVTNVYFKDKTFYVVLSDGSEVTWSVWVSCNARP